MSPSPTEDRDYVSELNEFLAKISDDQVKSEIQVLQSIYGDDAIRVWKPREGVVQDDKIRYEVHLSLPTPHEHIAIRVLVSLSQTYPSSTPPQLQLLSRYIGAFGADPNLFGSILRTYISVNGVEWSPDTVCVFDGLQNVLERCATWYEERLGMEKAGELVREDSRRHQHDAIDDIQNDVSEAENNNTLLVQPKSDPVDLPAGVHIYIAAPIIDRKSVFVGRACRIRHHSEVSLVLSHLTSDRRISRAAHPIINAWRCQVDGILHQGLVQHLTISKCFLELLSDNDDDGETAAGGRLAHLLQILEVDNVLVVVTRYFGGIHLGPDRFKHINQAARNALELGGFLDAVTDRKNVGRIKKH